MKSFLFLFIGVFFLAQPAWGQFSNHSISDDCQVYIAELEPRLYGYGVGIKVYVKSQVTHLTSDVKRMGFHYQRLHHFSGYDVGPWKTEEFRRDGERQGSWYLPLYFSTEEDYYEGVFFVEDNEGEYFWSYPSEDKHFLFDFKVYDILAELLAERQLEGDNNHRFSTLIDDLSHFNPDGCGAE